MKRINKLLAWVLMIALLLSLLTGCEIIESARELIEQSFADGVTDPSDSLEGGNGATDSGDGGDNGTVGGESEENSGNNDVGNNGSGGSDGSEDTDGGKNDGTDGDEYDRDYSTDPYENMSADEFYKDYEPAECYLDAFYRSKHYFLSGVISEQDQYQTVSDVRPKDNGRFIRNTSELYSDDGNTYYVVNYRGEIVNEIYRGGAYIMLEEVAAYVYAFGGVPANYVANKKASPSSSKWGVYLRLNHSKFSGDTSKYPYEPELPDISGCGGDLQYYEIDIGTTGTTCDPSFTATVYNNGVKITRGAARIVYARCYKSGDPITDSDEKYVFYTNNHYNDFSEYLNYEGGWGETFGNITGGGTISSETDYRPTPYVITVKLDLTERTVAYILALPVFLKEDML